MRKAKVRQNVSAAQEFSLMTVGSRMLFESTLRVYSMTYLVGTSGSLLPTP